ncbi:alpha/beta hydrolase [Patescibacteria group bacterium]|nr:MAG: alpha/beta hydrolase [Patescibacteria group bacterium]
MKTLLVPGWMKSVSFYKNFEGLDVWKKDFILADHRSVECVVAHSMGAAYALVEESIGNESTFYVLVNPVTTKISFVSWLWRWIKFAFAGGIRIDPSMSPKNIFSAARKAIKISGHDLDSIVAKMPKENIVIVRGNRDRYFCDEGVVRSARKSGLEVVEVDGLGHEWDEKFENVISELVSR